MWGSRLSTLMGSQQPAGTRETRVDALESLEASLSARLVGEAPHPLSPTLNDVIQTVRCACRACGSAGWCYVVIGQGRVSFSQHPDGVLRGARTSSSASKLGDSES